jgi:hypothetical protein
LIRMSSGSCFLLANGCYIRAHWPACAERNLPARAKGIFLVRV